VEAAYQDLVNKYQTPVQTTSTATVNKSANTAAFTPLTGPERIENQLMRSITPPHRHLKFCPQHFIVWACDSNNRGHKIQKFLLLVVCFW